MLCRSWRWDSNPQPADYKSAALPLSYASAVVVRLLLRSICLCDSDQFASLQARHSTPADGERERIVRKGDVSSKLQARFWTGTLAADRVQFPDARSVYRICRSHLGCGWDASGRRTGRRAVGRRRRGWQPRAPRWDPPAPGVEELARGGVEHLVQLGEGQLGLVAPFVLDAQPLEHQQILLVRAQDFSRRIRIFLRSSSK